MWMQIHHRLTGRRVGCGVSDVDIEIPQTPTGRRLGCGLSAPSSVTPTPLTSDMTPCELYWDSVLDVKQIYEKYIKINK